MALDSIWKSSKTLEQRANENHRDIDMQWIVENEANEFYTPSSKDESEIDKNVEAAMKAIEENQAKSEALLRELEEKNNSMKEEEEEIKRIINGDDVMIKRERPKGEEPTAEEIKAEIDRLLERAKPNNDKELVDVTAKADAKYEELTRKEPTAEEIKAKTRELLERTKPNSDKELADVTAKADAKYEELTRKEVSTEEQEINLWISQVLSNKELVDRLLIAFDQDFVNILNNCDPQKVEEIKICADILSHKDPKYASVAEMIDNYQISVGQKPNFSRK